MARSPDPVAEITVAGNLKDMFRELVPANDLVFRYATNVADAARRRDDGRRWLRR